MFASPAKDQDFRRGDEIEVKAVLIDPVLDMMVRNLDDTTHKVKKQFSGSNETYERDASLDPTVTVTNSKGREVATGVMPFG
jgi:hypothetical protein